MVWLLEEFAGEMTSFWHSGWNELSGEFTWTRDMDDTATGSTFLVLYAPAGLEMRLDDVQMVAV